MTLSEESLASALRGRIGKDNAELAYASSYFQLPWACSSSCQKSNSLTQRTFLL
jgi:hypothetical protein